MQPSNYPTNGPTGQRISEAAGR
ncbi:MAG TPA: hypothetical protein VIK33_06770 [Anaerolineae bacterium]